MIRARPLARSALLILLAAPLHASPLWPCGAGVNHDVLPRSLEPGYQGGPIIVDMSQMIRAADDPMPQGGAYGHSEDVSNLVLPLEMPLRITAFDAACDAIVIDGEPVSATMVPPGLRIGQSDGTMLLLAPDGYGAVVLRGVPSQLWADGAAMQIHGTAGSDRLQGTGGGDVLVPGGSRDLVMPGEGVQPGQDWLAPGAGDDRILFTRGTMVIDNTPPNSGTDSLDLRRFAATDLTLTTDGADLLITTPDGTLRLVGQLTDGNIETLLLTKDETLTAEALKAALP